jgi:hypothetical protein
LRRSYFAANSQPLGRILLLVFSNPVVRITSIVVNKVAERELRQSRKTWKEVDITLQD